MSDSIIRQAFEDDGLRSRSSVLLYEKGLNIMVVMLGVGTRAFKKIQFTYLKLIPKPFCFQNKLIIER